jgi:hypothetical protein
MHVTTPHLLLTLKKFCQPSCGISTFRLHICCLKQEKRQGGFQSTSGVGFEPHRSGKRAGRAPDAPRRTAFAFACL